MVISQHKSVLLEEVIRYISPKSPNIYVDATVGSGGHAERLLGKSNPKGKLIGIDVDPYMLGIANKRLKKFGKKCILIEDNFVNLAEILSGLNITEVDGIVFDLGVSTEHFMFPERGFSIQREGPLDMRLGPHGKLTAEYIVNEWEPEELRSILYRYGEESQAKKVTRYIIEERKKGRITTTTQLAEIVARAILPSRKRPKVPGYRTCPPKLASAKAPLSRRWRRRIHPATKIFQALRIAVNDELKNIERALPVAVGLLRIGGRLCVISFHSLEDRLVKNTFRTLAKPCICPPELPRCICGHKPKIKIITKKPVVPTKDEIAGNPRARSAKLRVVERI